MATFDIHLHKKIKDWSSTTKVSVTFAIDFSISNLKPKVH